MGVPIEENKFLFSLNYTDDQVVITHDADDLEFILKRVKANKESNINFYKAKFIAFRKTRDFT